MPAPLRSLGSNAVLFCSVLLSELLSGGIWDAVVINTFQLKPFGQSLLQICPSG